MSFVSAQLRQLFHYPVLSQDLIPVRLSVEIFKLQFGLFLINTFGCYSVIVNFIPYTVLLKKLMPLGAHFTNMVSL